MTPIDQLYLPGALTLWCAVFFGLATLWGYAQVMRGDQSALGFARRGYWFFTLSIVFCMLLLFLALARRDFRIEYVQQYSGLDLPLHYQVASFWAGQKGSFLVWLVFGALIGLPLMRSTGRDEPPVMGVYLLTLFGLLFILVRENPWVMLDHAPLDGDGLNPLLQDDWMVIHPPIMFVGYAAGAIPFAFAIAAMWRRDTSRWAAKAFPWAVGGFLVLGTAILMGGYWAYKTLGWGGYWGWDPVENASLIPWLLGIVLIHGLHLERTRGRFRRANLLFACLVYLAVLYSTYLTRSGVLADFSVHSFVELGISEWLIMMQLFFLGSSIYLLVTRMKTIETKPSEDPLLSRGAFLTLATITVLVSAVVIGIGTSAPLLTAWMEHPGQVGPSFYNRTNMPLALLMSFLLALVPYLTWKGTPPRALLRKLAPSALGATVITLLALVNGVHDPFHLLFVLLAGLAFSSNLHRTIELARSGGLKRAGGYMAHVGVGCMLIGVLASSAYDQSAKATLEQGVPQQVGDLTLTFKRFIPRQGYEKERMEVEVVRADGGSRYLAYPKLFVNDRTRQMMAHPDVQTLPLRDLYISPIQYHPGEQAPIEARLQLQAGEQQRALDFDVRFVAFELPDGGDPMVMLTSGRPVTVTARLEITRDGQTTEVAPLFRFEQNGQVQTPPAALPGGGLIALSSLDPRSGMAQLDITGVTNKGKPPALSVDVTKKPLIQLVWFGLYIILIGGLTSTLYRIRGARQADQLADTIAATK